MRVAPFISLLRAKTERELSHDYVGAHIQLDYICIDFLAQIDSL